MTTLQLNSLKSAGIAAFACAALEVLFSLLFDPEILLVGLLLSLMQMPSIAIFYSLEYCKGHRYSLPTIGFLALLLPLSVWFAMMGLSDGEAADIGRVLLGLYLLPAIGTLAIQLLVLPSRSG